MCVQFTREGACGENLTRYYDGKLSPPEEQKFRELLGRFIDGELAPKEQKVGELLNRCLGVDLSPEGQKFGELLFKYLDGTLPPRDLGTLQKQLREDPKRMTEFSA